MSKFTNKVIVVSLLTFIICFSSCGVSSRENANRYSVTEEFSVKDALHHIWGVLKEGIKEIAVKTIDRAYSIIGEDPDPSLVLVWPIEISRKDDEFSNESTSLYVHVYSPLQVKIDCETQSGRLDISIMNRDGKVYFEEERMTTGIYISDILDKGSYVIVIKANKHTGYFKISTSEFVE